jgi:alpha-ribazole phosphatase
MSFEETRALDPAAVERWARGEADFAFPGGERVADFVERTRAVGARLAADDADTVIAFTHGGVIRHLICHYLRLSDPRHPLMFDVRYASLTIIELHDGRGVLAGLGLVSTRRD